MLEILEIIVVYIAVFSLLAAVVLATEIAAAVWHPVADGRSTKKSNQNWIVVLIPAHNEQNGILETLNNVRRQLSERVKVVVVADNCTDETAAIARSQGVDVVERYDPERRGKGYALEFGIEHLRQSPPNVVIVLDADCHFSPGAIDALAATCQATGRPVQALDLIEVDPDAPLQERISALAFKLKNLVRFLGLKRLGVPCPLAGTGMAFPWPVIEAAPLGSGSIVEDMKLGVELAIRGHPALFEPRAKVTSRFPSTEEGRRTQRRRWEHGHLSTIAQEVPRLVWEALRQRRLDILGLALDLLVPPLSLFVLLTAMLIAVSTVLRVLGGTGTPLVISATSALLAGASLFAAWRIYGRDLLAPRELLAIPRYVAGKLPMYLRAIYKKETQWIRSARSKGESAVDD
ncbi:MAG: glycosyltransferase [Alphaproteobacteria bacterium]|nr:glycosyltransferase [Alphaproteobacteria bacterium]